MQKKFYIEEEDGHIWWVSEEDVIEDMKAFTEEYGDDLSGETTWSWFQKEYMDMPFITWHLHSRPQPKTEPDLYDVLSEWSE